MSQSYLTNPKYWTAAYEKRLKLIPGLNEKLIKNKVDYFRRLLHRQAPSNIPAFARNYIDTHS